ncbi:MAG: hypothetical protein Q8935_05855 [Bacillota bacterium]|jgi:hypothetical protein|nr:hypothetical protein [Bacillota bacterium]MDP4154212.1 hypothetical protein [Bacillota bacterium]
MNKLIKIQQATIENNRVQLLTNESITGLIPREHILVDSDNISFIYLMEENDHYVYIGLDESAWPALRESMNKKLPAYLISDNDQIELTSFQEEIEYIINNIKGNGNYGEEMVEKVEKTF